MNDDLNNYGDKRMLPVEVSLPKELYLRVQADAIEDDRDMSEMMRRQTKLYYLLREENEKLKRQVAKLELTIRDLTGSQIPRSQPEAAVPHFSMKPFPQRDVSG